MNSFQSFQTSSKFSLWSINTCTPISSQSQCSLLGLYQLIWESENIVLPCQGSLGNSLLHPLTIPSSHACGFESSEIQANITQTPYQSLFWLSAQAFGDQISVILSSGFLNCSTLEHIEQTCLEPFRVGEPAVVFIHPPRFQECCIKTFVLTLNAHIIHRFSFLCLF